MQSYYRRCRHCGSEYLYRINGHRWGLEDYTSSYCHECQEAITNALNAIPKKYDPRWRKSDKTLDDINRYFEARPYGKPYTPIDPNNKDWGYTINMDGAKYNVWITDEGPIISEHAEYDIQQEKFTGKLWKSNSPDDISQYRAYSITNHQQVPMDKPCGMLFYMDILPPTDKQTDNKLNKNK